MAAAQRGAAPGIQACTVNPVRPALLLLLSGCVAASGPVPAAPAIPAPAEGPAKPHAAATCEPGAACLGSAGAAEQPGSRNVLGERLQPCPSSHRTGFYRDGYCNTGADDHGVHVVCARVTDAFLAFSRERGNDLVTPRGGFPGLSAGDGWCLCAGRWQEAYAAGVAPPVVLEATHEVTLKTSSLEHLRSPVR